jgi:cell division protein FtsQ
MSSGYFYGTDIFRNSAENDAAHEYIQKQKSAAAYNKLKKILMFIAVVLGIELIWLFGISPCMPLSAVAISGIEGIDENAVLTLAGIGSHSSYMSVNSQAVEQALLSLPFVRSVHVVKHFPNRVDIILESRRPAAITFIETGGGTYPALIGGDGMLISVGRESFVTEETLPVVSGLVLDGIFPGMKLPRIYNALFARLETLSRNAPELLAAVSEIKINHKNYDGFDLILYPAHRGVRVRVGEEITEETIRYMFLMLDVLSAKNANIEEIDFRTGTASYKIKEAHSG